MNWRLFLLPFAGIYWLVTALRNAFYTYKILPSRRFSTPVICVGNLSVGGTGKSPHILYITEILQSMDISIAILSRGYKRKSKGYQVLNYQSSVDDVGDEPLMFFNRLKNSAIMAVCENRVFGVDKLIKDFKPQVILLDDGYQHRKIDPDFKILLTDYHRLYKDDYLLPTGYLREPGVGANRADIIIVTKCPADYEPSKIRNKLNPKAHQHLFFSNVAYQNQLIGKFRNIPRTEWADNKVILVTGIAKSKPLVEFVKANFQLEKHFAFPDHHGFNENEVRNICKVYEDLPNEKIILTTEKDFMRLKDEALLIEHLFYLPIDILLDQPEKFKHLITQHVRKV